jgi:lysophospholipase L1-like esterase
MINGTGSQCHYAAGSQLKAADAFIKKHKANIAFVTIDIGANDVEKCASGTTVNGPCLTAGLNSINMNIPKIASALRKAGGSKLKIVGMTYYDPFLADYLDSANGKALAGASQGLAKTFNGDISTGFAGSNIKVADVATNWKTYDPLTGPGSQTTTYKGQTVPVPVAIVCERTWMCAAKPKGPNIHANNTGYKDIAKLFKPLV